LRELVGQGVTVLLTTHNMQEVEEICDRVAILCRGRLVALDSPTALKLQHAERKVDVILEEGERLVVDLDSPKERAALGDMVRDGVITSLRTREFNFHEAFLKLTGNKFD
jgi:ABC-2 type transport system ATP-binding protein